MLTPDETKLIKLNGFIHLASTNVGWLISTEILSRFLNNRGLFSHTNVSEEYYPVMVRFAPFLSALPLCWGKAAILTSRSILYPVR